MADFQWSIFKYHPPLSSSNFTPTKRKSTAQMFLECRALEGPSNPYMCFASQVQLLQQ